MCLNSLSFSLAKRKSEYVGVGYKLMPKSSVKMNMWQEATVDTTKSNPYDKMLKCDISKENYLVGFHIFLNENDAKHYMDDATKNRKELKLYKVEFKNITAFGKNALWMSEQFYNGYEVVSSCSKTSLERDCVIAQNIRYIECLST